MQIARLYKYFSEKLNKEPWLDGCTLRYPIYDEGNESVVLISKDNVVMSIWDDGDEFALKLYMNSIYGGPMGEDYTIACFNGYDLNNVSEVLSRLITMLEKV